mgnify:FL=1
MKILFDQNISFRLIKRIEPLFPEAKHLSSLGLINEDDVEIWKYSKKHDFTIVTFDSDFYDYSIVWGAPPKIIWIRAGNLTTKSVEEILRKQQNNIVYLLFVSLSV